MSIAASASAPARQRAAQEARAEAAGLVDDPPHRPRRVGEASDSGWRHPAVLVLLGALVSLASTLLISLQADQSTKESARSARQFDAYVDLLVAVTEADVILVDAAREASSSDPSQQRLDEICGDFESFVGETYRPAAVKVQVLGSPEVASGVRVLGSNIWCDPTVDRVSHCELQTRRRAAVDEFVGIVRNEFGEGDLPEPDGTHDSGCF